MLDKEFPVNYFISTMVRLLDTIQHNDENYTHDERVQNLHYVYKEAVNHFTQPCVRYTLTVQPKKLQAGLETVTAMVVYSWAKASPELMAALVIHYTYALILDDGKDNPYPKMETFFNDMAEGKPQKHPWLRLVNEHFPSVLNRYGPFCALDIYRSTLDCMSTH